MNKISILAAGVCAAAFGAAVLRGAGGAAADRQLLGRRGDAERVRRGHDGRRRRRPNMSQIMSMMSGNAPSVCAHAGAAARVARPRRPRRPPPNHLIPPGLQMGPSLPLVTPPAAKPVKETYGMPPGYEKPKGRMLIYWGCGEHVGAGQPTVIDFAKLAAGQVPPGMAAMANAARMAERAAQRAGLSANGRTPRTAARSRRADR